MDFDSEELLLSAFDEEFQVEDETQELRVQDLPFSNCNDTFQDFKTKIDNLQKKNFPEETFGYESLPSDILEKMTLQNILCLQMGHQEEIKEYIVNQLTFILAKYTTQISDQKDSITQCRTPPRGDASAAAEQVKVRLLENDKLLEFGSLESKSICIIGI